MDQLKDYVKLIYILCDMAFFQTAFGQKLVIKWLGFFFVSPRARRRRKRQANSGGVGLTITEAEISFFTSDDSASILVGVSKVLHDLELGAGLKLFAGQQKEVTCLLQFPEVAKQSETLGRSLLRPKIY